MTNLILKLILFPFLVLIFLLKGVAALFRSDQSDLIPKIIEKLASEHSPLGTAINELKFNQVLTYASRKNLITVRQANIFEFEIDVDGKRYHAAITRAPDGSNCAIFRCQQVTDHVIPLVQASTRTGRAGVEYAEASRAPDKELNRVITVADNHVETWDDPQDQMALDRKAEIEKNRAALKAAKVAQALHSFKKNSNADDPSQSETAELASVINGLGAIFDKHAEKIKW